MLFNMMIVLAISSFLVEMMFAAKLPWWRRNAYKYKWFNMVISIALSWFLGFVFGAAGLVVLGAALISTALSVPGYAILNWNYDTIDAKKYNTGKFSVVFKKWTQAFSDFGKVIYSIIRVITFPIWSIRWLVNKLSLLNK